MMRHRNSHGTEAMDASEALFRPPDCPQPPDLLYDLRYILSGILRIDTGHEVKPDRLEGVLVPAKPPLNEARAKKEDNDRNQNLLLFALLDIRASEREDWRASCGSHVNALVHPSCKGTAPAARIVFSANLHKKTHLSYNNLCLDQQTTLWEVQCHKLPDDTLRVLCLQSVPGPRKILLSPIPNQCLVASERRASKKRPFFNPASHLPSRFTASGSHTPNYIIDAAPISYTLITPRATPLLFPRPHHIIEVATSTVAHPSTKAGCSYNASLRQGTEGPDKPLPNGPPPGPPITPLPEPEDKNVTIQNLSSSEVPNGPPPGPPIAPLPEPEDELDIIRRIRSSKGDGHIPVSAPFLCSEAHVLSGPNAGPPAPPPGPPIQPLPEPEDNSSSFSASSFFGHSRFKSSPGAQRCHEPKTRASTVPRVISTLGANVLASITFPTAAELAFN